MGDSFPTNGTETTAYPYAKLLIWTLTSHQIQKKETKQTLQHKHKGNSKTTKHLEENTGENLNDFGLKTTLNAQLIKEKKLTNQTSSYLKISHYKEDEKISHGLRENMCKSCI